MVVGAGPSSEYLLLVFGFWFYELILSGADLVRELGMLRVQQSPFAPHRIYRSIRSKPRYDTEHSKGWSEHITNITPIQNVESPSLHSATGRVTTVSEEVLDDVDVGNIHPTPLTYSTS